jgi:parvulin-like peptidyl-prolyl isomerase
MYQYGPDAINAMGMAKFTEQVIEEMISNRLLLQKADDLDIIVSRDEIDPVVEDNIRIIKEQYPTEEEFRAMLEQYGMTEKKLKKQYRKNIKDQITIKNLVDMEIMPKIEIAEEDARAHYEINKSDFDIPIMVAISEIVVAKKISPQSELRAKALADEVRGKAIGGTDFSFLAETYSAGGNAASGGYFNFSTGESYPEIEEAVDSLNPGQVSKPIQLPDGYWVIKLLEKSNGDYKTQVILIPVELTSQDIAAARSKIEEAYAELESGKPFGEVAAVYNEDVEFTDSSGYVGEFAMSGLQRDFPQIAAELEYMSAGDFTSVIERVEGFYIVELNERMEGESRDYDAARDEVIYELRMEKLDAELEEYIAELKEASYVKIIQE